MDTTLYYVHDPMCSWCWGFRPTWDAIRTALPAEQRVIELLGGLAPDTDEPMPAKMRYYLQQTWRTIQSQLGTPFNFDFWQQCQPRRATYPACRAVIAAEKQDAGELMVQAIQHAYYLRAMNPSEDAVLTTLATELGLDTKRFASDLSDPATTVELHHQITLSRQLGADSFPSLIYVTDHGGPRRIAHHYQDPQHTLEQLYGVEHSQL